MARTAGVPKADKSLKGVEIDWCGNPIRDGRGYYGEPGNAPEPVKGGAFPPAVPSGPDDVSRRRFSPAEALRKEMAGGTAPSIVTTQKIVNGAVVEQAPVKSRSGNTLKEFWAKLRADPAAMEAFLAKKKAGFEKWRAKRKAKNA